MRCPALRIPTRTVTAMGEAAGAAMPPDLVLVQLMTWLSPAFPVGGFAVSHGLEVAVREGRVADEAAATSWIAGLLEGGSGWNDLVLLAEAYRATEARDGVRLMEVADLALALAGSSARREETADLGAAFKLAAAPWSGEGGAGELAYPLAVARLCAGRGVPLPLALSAYASAFAATLLSAAQRLVPLGQAAVTRAQAALEPAILAAARRAAGSTLDDLGSRSLLSDLCALKHETLQPRLFRS